MNQDTLELVLEHVLCDKDRYAMASVCKQWQMWMQHKVRVIQDRQNALKNPCFYVILQITKLEYLFGNEIKEQELHLSHVRRFQHFSMPRFQVKHLVLHDVHVSEIVNTIFHGMHTLELDSCYFTEQIVLDHHLRRLVIRNCPELQLTVPSTVHDVTVLPTHDGIRLCGSVLSLNATQWGNLRVLNTLRLSLTTTYQEEFFVIPNTPRHIFLVCVCQVKFPLMLNLLETLSITTERIMVPSGECMPRLRELYLKQNRAQGQGQGQGRLERFAVLETATFYGIIITDVIECPKLERLVCM